MQFYQISNFLSGDIMLKTLLAESLDIKIREMQETSVFQYFTYFSEVTVAHNTE